MRFSAIFAAAAITALPAVSSAAVMVAHFEGSVGGIHSTFTDRFGVPPMHVFSGPFVAEFTFDPDAGSALTLSPGSEGRSGAVLDAWIEFGGVRLDLPTAEFSQVIASATGFSISAQHYIPNVVLDSISISANFAGATGDLAAVLAPLSATGGGHVSAASNYTGGGYKIDLTGNCVYECAGMELRVTDVWVSEYATPGAVPEPATWAMMILGFGRGQHA